jgi:hypothetical protein
MSDTLMIISGIATTFSAAFTGWFFGRRKTNADAETVEISNRITVSDHHKKMLDDLQPRYEAQFSELVKTFEHKVRLLEEQVEFLKVQNLESQNLYEQKIKMLNSEIVLLKRQNKMKSVENSELIKRLKQYEQ